MALEKNDKIRAAIVASQLIDLYNNNKAQFAEILTKGTQATPENPAIPASEIEAALGSSAHELRAFAGLPASEPKLEVLPPA